METILIALIVSVSTLGGVYLGTRLTIKESPRNEPKEIPKQESILDTVKELYNLEDEKERKNFEDLTNALNWNGEQDV